MSPVYTPPTAVPDASQRPYNVDAQGVDDSFRPNGSYDQVWFGMMTGTQVAARARGIDNLPGYYDESSQEGLCPVTVFFRRGEHDLEISLEGQDQWRCAEPPLGVPDRFDTTEMADWVERAWVSLEQHRPQSETPDAPEGTSGGGSSKTPPGSG